MAVFLARIVMPRSRSSSFESMTRSATASLARNVPDWRSMASTRVVLPWSTWAMMAMLRMGCDAVLTGGEILSYEIGYGFRRGGSGAGRREKNATYQVYRRWGGVSPRRS